MKLGGRPYVSGNSLSGKCMLLQETEPGLSRLWPDTVVGRQVEDERGEMYDCVEEVRGG
jgi:hypothetical protein